MQWLRIISSECWLRSVVTTVVHINCYIRLMLVVVAHNGSEEGRVRG